MSDRSAMRTAGRRAPAVLLLCALVALLAGVCHGAHGHGLPSVGAAPGLSAPGVSAPGLFAPELPHGCERPGEGWSFDAHLPAQAAGTQHPAPQAAGPAPLTSDEPFGPAPHTRCVRDRAGPGPRPGSLLISLGVDRN
ncbi:hypothetical protein ACFU3J_08565 [Streptomyces sp. NPDC057411]|uniref:hypothetical protein n=1 Tax=unclassified Streptomyces TaxID=2593676 RepID=UPI0036416246